MSVVVSQVELLSSCRYKCFQLANETTMAFIIIIILIFVYLPMDVPLVYWLNANTPFQMSQYFSKSEKYQTASCGFSLRVAQRDSVVIFLGGGGGSVPIKETVGNYTKLKEVVQPQLSGLMVIYSGAEWRPLPLPCLMVTFRFINGPDEGSGRERLFPLSS